MTDLFKKLNFKGHTSIVLLHPPDSFLLHAEAMTPFTAVRYAFSEKDENPFVLAFACTQAQVDAFALEFSKQTTGDAIHWIAYPKTSSKRYRCDFNRDTGWALLGELGFEPVRQVAIDEDWSALRFRRVGYVQKMTRSFAMTAEGKAKSQAQNLQMPTDLQAALEARHSALTAFNKLAPSHQKEYIRWITEAKKDETRARRIAQAITKLG